MKMQISFLVVLTVSGLSGVLAAAEAGTCAKVERVSVDSGEVGGDGESYPSFQSMSGDGRYVAFSTYSDLSGGHDRDGVFDVYLRDREAGLTRLVGRKCVPSGLVGYTDSPSLSADGMWLSYIGVFPCGVDADVSVLEVMNLATGNVSIADLDATGRPEEVGEPASLSADGGLIVYSNRSGHIILRNLRNGSREVISEAPSPAEDDGANFPHITPDGRFVVFQNQDSVSGEFYSSIVYDRRTGIREAINRGPDGSVVPVSTHGSISDDGRYVAFDGFDPSGIYLRDRTTRTTLRIAEEGEVPVISPSGRYVAFGGLTPASIGRIPFVYDRVTGRTVNVYEALRIPETADSGGVLQFSAGDDFFVFYTFEDGLVSGDNNQNPDVFVVDVESLFADPGSCSETPSPGSTPSTGLDPEGDKDADGVKNGDDNCPYKFNPGQQDVDEDGKGDFCDVVLSRSAPVAAGGCELIK